MLRARADDIDTRRFDAAVAEKIGKLHDVLFDAVENARKQVAQIVGKGLLRSTPAERQSDFISRQMLVRSMGLPVRVTKTAPEEIFCFSM